MPSRAERVLSLDGTLAVGALRPEPSSALGNVICSSTASVTERSAGWTRPPRRSACRTIAALLNSRHLTRGPSWLEPPHASGAESPERGLKTEVAIPQSSYDPGHQTTFRTVDGCMTLATGDLPRRLCSGRRPGG